MNRGLILGVHHNSPPDHFVVLRIIRGNEYPPVNISREVMAHQTVTTFGSQRAYTKVWWQPLDEGLIPADKPEAP